MALEVSASASDQPLLHVRLERGYVLGDDRTGVLELLSAIKTLAEAWLEPLGVGYQLAYRDRAKRLEKAGAPPRPNHFLQGPRREDVRVEEAFPDSVIEEVPELDAAAIRAAIVRAQEQPSPTGLLLSLSEVCWTAVRAWAPVAEPVELMVGGLPVQAATELVDGERWYLGPTRGIAGPPVRLRGINAHLATIIDIDVFWDLWARNIAGRTVLDAGIGRVLTRGGWQRVRG